MKDHRLTLFHFICGMTAGMLSIRTWGWTWWFPLHTSLGWIYVIYWTIFLSGWIR